MNASSLVDVMGQEVAEAALQTFSSIREIIDVAMLKPYERSITIPRIRGSDLHS